MTTRRKTPSQKRKEAREARAADPYAYQRYLDREHRRAEGRKKVKARIKEKLAPMYTLHSNNEIEDARARLYHHVDKYKDYADRDRDILLLAIYNIVRFGSR